MNMRLNMRRKAFHFLSILAGAALLGTAGPSWAAGAAGTDSPDWDAAARRVLAEHLRPRHAHFADVAEGLNRAAREFCAHPGADGLARLQEAYRTALSGWMGIQHVTFGPIEGFNRKARLQFWPDKRNAIPRHLAKLLSAKPQDIFLPENFIFTSVALQGFPALERLTFGDEAAALLSGGDEAAYRCRFVGAVSANIADVAAKLRDEWSLADDPDGFGYYAAGEATGEEVMSWLLTGINGHLELIRDQKLSPVMGDSPDGARPKAGESWRSGRSLANIADNIDAIWDGVRAGLLPALERRDPELAALLTRAFAATSETVRAVPMPLSDAVRDPAQRKRLETLDVQLRALRQLAAERTAERLGLTLGFNSTDGD